MKKQLVTALVVTSALALGACQEDPLMNELDQDTELNEVVYPNGEEDKDKPGEGVGGNN